MRQLVLIPLLLLLAGCPGVRHAIVRPDKNPPQLRTRPNFNGVHYEVPTLCIRKVEYYQGWCEDGQEPGVLLCHDVIMKVPAACVVIKAGK